MSHRHWKTRRRLIPTTCKQLPVFSKCLAIVFLPRKVGSANLERQLQCGVNKGASSTILSPVATATSPAVGSSEVETSILKRFSSDGRQGKELCGKEILHDFKEQNAKCYWNPALIETINSLEYVGFVEPCTVLVTGAESHLEILRSAWGRRVLKPPSNHSIVRIGDIDGMEMQVIPQTQFIPLPDSLCLIVADLNASKIPATLEAIRCYLQRGYSNSSLPSHQLIYDTLGQLTNGNKVFHNGRGYCVVTPEMSHMTASEHPIGCTASWLPYPANHLTAFPSLPERRPSMRSISCQVSQLGERAVSDSSTVVSRRTHRIRSDSVKSSRRHRQSKVSDSEKENAAYKRSSSVHFLPRKTNFLTKDANLKASNIKQNKRKGGKLWFFSKIFGRKKKPVTVSSAAATSDQAPEASPSTDVELATFSAQFPPAEWLWYRQQLEKQQRTELLVTEQPPPPCTRGYVTSVGDVVAAPSVGDGGCVGGISDQQPTVRGVAGRSHVYAHLEEQFCGGGGVGKGDGEWQDTDIMRRLVSSYRSGHRSHCQQRFDRHPHRQTAADNGVARRVLRENNYDIVDCRTRRPISDGSGFPGHDPNVSPDHANCSHGERKVYSTPEATRYGNNELWHSTPCYDVPRHAFESQAMPSQIAENTMLSRVALKSARRQRKGDFSRRVRSRRNRGKMCEPSMATDSDITIEYNGRMPRRNTSFALSKDSGVNCMGVPLNRRLHLDEGPTVVGDGSPVYSPSRFDCAMVTTTSPTPATDSTHPNTLCTSPDPHQDERFADAIDPMGGRTAGPFTDKDSGGAFKMDCLAFVTLNSSRALEARSDGEGVSYTSYVAAGPSLTAVQEHTPNVVPDNTMSESHRRRASPQYMSTSCYDSSMADDGGEVRLCQVDNVLANGLRSDETPAYQPTGDEYGILPPSGRCSRQMLIHPMDDSGQSVDTVIVSLSSKFYNAKASSDSLVEIPRGGRLLVGSLDEMQRHQSVIHGLDSEFKGMMVDNRDGILTCDADNGSGFNDRTRHERIKAFVRQSNQFLERHQFAGYGHDDISSAPERLAFHPVMCDGYVNCLVPSHALYVPASVAMRNTLSSAPDGVPASVLAATQSFAVSSNQRCQRHDDVRPVSLYACDLERSKVQNGWRGQDQCQKGDGEKLQADLKVFHRDQLKGKFVGLDGEFELVGVV